MHRFPGLLGAAGAAVILFAACGGKVVVDAPSASGAGGDGGASTSEVTVSGVTTGSSGSCDPTYTCFAAISLDSLDPGQLCPGSDSAALHDALLQCACVDACAFECGDTACVGVEGSPSCKACVADPMTGCAMQLNACLQDK